MLHSTRTAAPLLVLGLLLVVAPGADARTWRVPKRRAQVENPVAGDTASLDSGTELYRAECESCHGRTGRGDGPDAAEVESEVPDLTHPGVAAQSDGTLFWKLTVGRKPMPGFRRQFTDEERWDLVNFLRLLMSPTVSTSGVEGPQGEG